MNRKSYRFHADNSVSENLICFVNLQQKCMQKLLSKILKQSHSHIDCKHSSYKRNTGHKNSLSTNSFIIKICSSVAPWPFYKIELPYVCKSTDLRTMYKIIKINLLKFIILDMVLQQQYIYVNYLLHFKRTQILFLKEYKTNFKLFLHFSIQSC